MKLYFLFFKICLYSYFDHAKHLFATSFYKRNNQTIQRKLEDPQAFIIIGLIVLIIILISCASSKFVFKFCKKLASSDKSALVTKDCEKEAMELTMCCTMSSKSFLQHQPQYMEAKTEIKISRSQFHHPCNVTRFV